MTNAPTPAPDPLDAAPATGEPRGLWGTSSYPWAWAPVGVVFVPVLILAIPFIAPAALLVLLVAAAAAIVKLAWMGVVRLGALLGPEPASHRELHGASQPMPDADTLTYLPR